MYVFYSILEKPKSFDFGFLKESIISRVEAMAKLWNGIKSLLRYDMSIFNQKSEQIFPID